MKASFVATALLALGAAAAPLEKRNNGGGNNNGGGDGISDVAILQYALTLEHLENTFYSQALQKYSEQDFTDAGFDSSVRAKVERISGDEQTHVDFLSSALQSLGQTPVEPCTYNFGYNDVKSFLATSSILEGVGVSAYLGAAASIASKTYLTAAGAILTVESRHSAYIRNTIGQSPFPEPFDTPLDFNEVYSLASLFIESCPSSNPSLPVKAFPVLSASFTGDKMIKLTPADGVSLPNQQLYAVFIGYPSNQVGEYNQKTMVVEYPYWQEGPQYVVLSTAKEPTDDTIVAGPAVIEIPVSSS